MQQLRDALRNQANAPQEPSHQQQVSDALNRLTSTLPNAPSNGFPPTWQEVLDELHLSPLLGNQLLESVQETFDRNQITPSIAADEVQRLTEQLESANNTVNQLVSSLASLEIGSEDLDVGDAEVSVLIPRSAVNEGLEALGDEFVDLQKLFGPFLEMGIGSRPPLRVRSISSSDFGVFVDVAPKVAALVAVAVERVVAVYKSLLEIRKLRQELSEQGVPDTELAGVDQHANNHMEAGISEVVDEMLPATDSADGRTHELRIELRLSLNGIANRIDHGYNIDVRAGPEPDSTDESDENGTAQAFQTIRNASPNLQFLNRSGQPILSLPEADSGPEE